MANQETEKTLASLETSISILAYNTHLFPGNAGTVIAGLRCQDELRTHIIAYRIAKEIENYRADIIGLVEVWNFLDQDDLASKIIDLNQNSYPYYYRPPVETSITQLFGHGLLLLSKYPLSEQEFYVYEDIGGWDQLSSKGFLTAKAELTNPTADGKPIKVRLFLTHTQAAGSNDSYESIRQANIAQLTKTIQDYQTGEAGNSDTDIPVFAFGDFNVIAEDKNTGQPTSEYQKTLACFEEVKLIDFYRQLDNFDDSPGYTYFSDGEGQRNKLITKFDLEGARNKVHQRLDYIFYSQKNSEVQVTPTRSQIFTDYTYNDGSEEMDLSDHEPLWGEFNLGN